MTFFQCSVFSVKPRKGFTLVELIIVIAIIAILAGAIFVAIDPARRLHEARNARRNADVATILDAIKKYQVDNEGSLYSTIDAINEGDFYVIGTVDEGCDIECGGDTPEPECVDLSGMGSGYLAVVPQDPKVGTATISGYYIVKETAITIGACAAEGEGPGGDGTPPVISITR